METIRQFLTNLIYLPEVKYALDAVFKMALAVLFSGVIGYEREHSHRPAGFRTHILVAVGSALVMMTSGYVFNEYAGLGTFDPTRLGAQVISGIGFLGAGTILREGFSVKGLTTAASLWAVSCIGLAVGAGYYTGALVSTIVIYLTLNTFKRFVIRGNPSKNIYIEAENMTKQAADVGAIIKRYGGNLHTLEILYADSNQSKRKSDSVVMKAVVFPRDEEGLNLTISAIRSLEGIRDLYID
ncbi:MAG: MgtC/SapB family protein [Clostridia bacterium]|nr:MgtC/SapB family protein [Clostridia bacterium]MBQ1995146.1 MgtC/SapB family protein [Clostridia bacterium]MBQ5904837.1 MgtC/SapB family protein [Clostridia bacterium]